MYDRIKILIATDYSDAVMNAERYAVQLAKNINASLVFLHIYETPYNPLSEAEELKISAEEHYRSEMKRMTKHCDELLPFLGISPGELIYECIVREGTNIGQQIAREAEISKADFIITGTHGTGGFRKLFFGSRSWEVIKRSNIPVFTIPKDALFRGVKNIVFGMEYREGEIPSLNFLIRFARMFDAEVTVLHITNYILSKRFEKEMFEKFRNEVLNKTTYPRLKMHLMVSENISEGVHRFCAENNTDLLAMSPKKHYLFENLFMTNMSMTRKTIFHTHIPLLAIPDFYDHELQELSGAAGSDKSNDTF